MLVAGQVEHVSIDRHEHGGSQQDHLGRGLAYAISVRKLAGAAPDGSQCWVLRSFPEGPQQMTAGGRQVAG
jgi:hypothetical protein